jgi:UDP-glucuronate 4-epimerase
MSPIDLNEKIVVLGGAGFLGSHVVEKFLQEGLRSVTVVDSLSESLYSSEGRRRWLESLNHLPVKVLEADFASIESLEACADAHTVVNLAAIPGLRKSWEDPSEVFKINFLKVHELVNSLETMSKPPYLIHASTSSVYGEIAIGDEDSPRIPVSPYGISKLAAELRLEAIRASSALNWCSLRFFSIYGPRQRDDMAYQRLILAGLRGNDFHLFGNGNQKRSNTFVTDAAEAIFLCHVRKPNRTAINIAGSELFSLNEAIDLIKGLELTVKIINEPSAHGDQRVTLGDISKAWKLLGWKPRVTLNEGIKLQYQFLQTQET